uniref:Cytochrome b5 heme-binding domain-containing protein n=1 Tax=Wuchereria bancrofti TaxID=6293 RepID=A0AAF5PRC9_WUCBA
MSQKPMQSNHGNERRSDRSVSAVRRKLYFPRPQLHTSALICCALQAMFISFLFSYNGVNTGDVLFPVLSWISEQSRKLPLVQSTIDFVRGLLDSLFSLISDENPETSTSSTKESRAKQKVDTSSAVFMEKVDASLPVLTREQLSFFDGTRPSKGTYLAILGRIYDVQKGSKHYGPGGSYNFFAGRDATRAFVSGDFSEKGLVDDIQGLNDQDLLGIFDWVKFYEKDYDLAGYLQGTYYDASGNPTSRLKEVVKLIENALHWKDMQVQEAKIFPPCNSEWQKDIGGRVWCSKKSGGIEREWVGVPRKLFDAQSKSYRCACVKNFGAPLSRFPGMNKDSGHGDLRNPNLEEYEGCKSTSTTCRNDNS